MKKSSIISIFNELDIDIIDNYDDINYDDGLEYIDFTVECTKLKAWQRAKCTVYLDKLRKKYSIDYQILRENGNEIYYFYHPFS